MKIRHLKVSAVLLAATLLTSSCVGSFALFNKLAGWNKQATDNKFLNELIFILISPAYAVCTFADVLVINSIEFWTGSNPMAQRVGETQEITGKDGKLYAVTTLRNGYKVKSPDGEVIKFKYDKKTNSWSKEEKGKIEELFRINDDALSRLVCRTVVQSPSHPTQPVSTRHAWLQPVLASGHSDSLLVLLYCNNIDVKKRSLGFARGSSFLLVCLYAYMLVCVSILSVRCISCFC